MAFPLPFIISALQLVAILLISLILGTVFGIWRGYDPAGYSASTFIEVQQGAIRGLNTLIPVLGLAALLITATLAVLSRDRPGVLWLYASALAAIAVAGAVTRFGNQPINARVMTWTPTTLPADWTAIRDTWWNLHLVRLAASFAGEVLLIGAVFADRS